jgi:putative DNA primase/helicase
MKRIRHVDLTGLPEKFDLADLVESGTTGDNLKAWFKERTKDGPPVVRRRKKPKTEKKAAPKTNGTKPPSGQSNVVPIPAPTKKENEDVPPEYSEDSLALRFTGRYLERLAYCPAIGWLDWTGSIWEEDNSGLALDLARKVCRDAANEAEANMELGSRRKTIANTISSRRSFANVEAIARTDRRHIVKASDFDADPWVLNTPDGIVNLKSGNIRKARRSDLCLKSTAVGPGDECPTWLRFLRDCTLDDPDLIRYLRRVAGYCLTGSISEHVFFFAYGSGGNGKGTFMNLLLWLMNTYARVSNMDTFTESRFSRHAAELAYQQGARIVTASETNQGQRWNEARVKSMTGGDPITANFMHKDPFTYQPTFKLVFAGNNRPHLRNVDDAIKRRLYLIPFDYKIPDDKRDGDLPDKLQAEGPGILSWAIKGCLDWQRNSLDPPDRVIATTAEYFAAEDVIGTFIEECCEVGAQFTTRTTYLYERFVRWADSTGERSGARPVFLEMMKSKGFMSVRRGGEQIIDGLRIAPEDEPPARWDGYQ